MKINKHVTSFVCSVFFLFNLTIAQSQINYGSNNGQYIQIDNLDIYYEKYGVGTPTILLHGGLGSISDFKNVIPELSKHYQLYAIDSPGHGRSQYLDSMSYNNLAKYVVKFLVKLDLNKVNIIGYSDGAIIGIHVAHLAPNRIDKLIFGAGALNPKASKPEGLKMLQNFSPKLLPEEFAIAYREKSPNPDQWENFIYASKRMWLDEVWIPDELISNLKCKVLVLFGDRDPFIHLNHSVEIHTKLSNSELCILPDIGHEIFSNPELVNPMILNFLSK
ncbi:alpha/beta hydrolase [Yeosuana sp. MJ-SS3]|uniref:Alpha/beta hydrolase n=1 Tax=Gilvirhabdus luticola TaxID=3079858 RepID=A0ABU3U855_9FLAO|nr:alpha/beta hydrolase [Yeosuana sp. MJ-SS3]MDU8886499.1 alpha/beta hydrolase [Yeosuana sp. MJ-SS3]